MYERDIGHKFTDKELARVEARLKSEYAQALREMQAKSVKVLEQFDKNDKIMLSKLRKNKISLKDYKEWRRKSVLRTEQVEGLINELSARMVHTDKIASDIINNAIPSVYAENMNFITYEIEKQARLDTGFTLISEDAVKRLVRGDKIHLPRAKVYIPKDKRWNREHIRSALTQGIIQGENPYKVAKRLQKVTNMDNVAAVRNARTLMGGAQNAGRMDSMYRARDLGLEVKKVWIAKLDNVTRDSHADLDGEEQDLDRPFSNGLDYPGAAGPPEEVYNCRCDVRPQYIKYRTDFTDLKLRNTDKLDDMSYDEWKRRHK